MVPFSTLLGASDSLSMGEKWATSGITTLIGLGMTFVILALIIGMIFMLRLVLKELDKLLPHLKKKSLQVAEPVTATASPMPVETEKEKPIEKDTLDAIYAAVMNFAKKDDNVVIIKSVSRADKTEPQQAETPSEVSSAPTPSPTPQGKGHSVKAPMPGTLLKIVAQNGKQVKEGEVIFVLEAMKMENDIVSPASGTFQATIAEGSKVNTGDLLAEIQ